MAFVLTAIFPSSLSFIVLVFCFFPGRRIRLLRLIGRPIVCHTLGKLADMVEVAADFRMVLVNKAAGTLHLFSPRGCDDDLPAIRDAKQLLVMGVDKADTLLGFSDMSVKPVLHI